MALAPAQQKYEIKGTPITLPYEIVQLGLNDDGLGREVIARTNEAFRGNRYMELDISSLGRNKPIDHSNTFRKHAWAPEARKLAPELVLQSPKLHAILAVSGVIPDVNTTYEDLGVVIYSLDGPNPELAQHLVKQLGDRKIDFKLPIEIHNLKTVKDDGFPHGLRLDLADVFDVRGFPGELGEVGMKIYTANSGLRGLYRVRGLGLSADDVDLPVSSEAGRVSFVKGAAPQNLEATVAEIEALKRRHIAELEEAHKRAITEKNARFEQAMELYKRRL